METGYSTIQDKSGKCLTEEKEILSVLLRTTTMRVVDNAVLCSHLQHPPRFSSITEKGEVCRSVQQNLFKLAGRP